MASPTRRTWVWVSSGGWWWTGRPGVLRFVGLQRVGHDRATELNWSEAQNVRGRQKNSVIKVDDISMQCFKNKNKWIKCHDGLNRILNKDRIGRFGAPGLGRARTNLDLWLYQERSHTHRAKGVPGGPRGKAQKCPRPVLKDLTPKSLVPIIALY